MVVATKELTFVNHKMGSKKVHLIAGFGAASATKLAQKGYAKVSRTTIGRTKFFNCEENHDNNHYNV